jgi:hypothetical protein
MESCSGFERKLRSELVSLNESFEIRIDDIDFIFK